MRVLLQCGHQLRNEQAGANYYECPHCNIDVKPMAFECREWKIECNSKCSYSRWFGQDKVAANIAVNVHNSRTGHTMHVDYLIHPVIQGLIRSIYGKKIYLRIDKAPVPKRFPEVRSWQPSLPVESDVPPF